MLKKILTKSSKYLLVLLFVVSKNSSGSNKNSRNKLVKILVTAKRQNLSKSKNLINIQNANKISKSHLLLFKIEIIYFKLR